MDLITIKNQIIKGDPEAFRLLFEKYKNLVFRTAYLMLGDTHEAEDILQEVFIQVFRHIASYQPEKGAFSTWLYRITANQCKNLRRRRVILTVPLPWGLFSSQKGAYYTESSLAENQPVQQALMKLSDKVRDVVILRYYGNLSYAEIAESLEIPIGTVQSRLNWGLKFLKKELDLTDPFLGIEKEEILK